MNEDAARRHAILLVLMPVAVHAVFAALFGSEAETSSMMLFGAMLSAAAIGGFLCAFRYGLAVSAVGSAWPSALAVSFHWHWAHGFASPGGSAQALARWAGWLYAPAPAALLVILAASGTAGWLFIRFDRWYEKKTGRSLFDG